jgi:hypothetical protein
VNVCPTAIFSSTFNWVCVRPCVRACELADQNLATIIYTQTTTPNRALFYLPHKELGEEAQLLLPRWSEFCWWWVECEPEYCCSSCLYPPVIGGVRRKPGGCKSVGGGGGGGGGYCCCA